LVSIKKEPHPVFDLTQILPSSLALRGWGWGFREFGFFSILNFEF
jgi:hypothetical protein